MKKHIASVGISLILALLMAVLSPMQVFAASKQQYISDMRMAGSVEKLEALGYTVLDQDLNAGGNEGFTYIGYKTTTDPTEAITDISVMDMKGGYSYGDYEVILNQQKKQIQDSLELYRTVFAEFRSEYQRGSIPAKYAYIALNKYVEDDSGRGMGDLFLDEALSDDDIIKIYMQASVLANSTLAQCLAIGVSLTGDRCWLDHVGDAENTDDDFYDDAEMVLPSLDSLRTLMQSYLDTGASLLDQDERNAYLAEGGELSAEDYADGGAIYEALNARAYKGGTLADLFMKEDLTQEDLYPVFRAMTPGQRAIVWLSGFGMLIKASASDKVIWEVMEEKFDGDALAQDAAASQKISIYTGVDRSMFEGGVALTSDAKRKSASTGDNSWFFGNMSSAAETTYFITGGIVFLGGLITAVSIAASTSASASASVLSVAEVSASIGEDSFWLKLADQLLERTGSISPLTDSTTKAVAAPMSTGSIIVAVAMITLAILAIITMAFLIAEYVNYRDPTYTKIPFILMDLKYGEDDDVGDWEKYIRYNVVRDETGEAADLNAFSAKQWNAVYTTKDRAAGDPITADSLIAKYGDSATPRGYFPVHYFGNTDAFDLNSHCFNNKVDGIFLFFERDSNAFASEAASVFSGGALAVVTGFGGLLLGIMGTFGFIKKKKAPTVEHA